MGGGRAWTVHCPSELGSAVSFCHMDHTTCLYFITTIVLHQELIFIITDSWNRWANPVRKTHET